MERDERDAHEDRRPEPPGADDRALDEALEESFPASDPVAVTRRGAD